MHKISIEIGGKTWEFEVGDGANLLLEAASRSVPVPFRCTTGRCGTCRILIEQGHEHLSDPTEMEDYHLDEHEWARGMRLACQTFVYGDVRARAE